MKIDILIDKLTPCLEEVATGKILQTTFSIASPTEIKGIRDKGWLFNWEGEELKGINTNIYKLQLKDDDVIQGLVATEIHTGTLLVHLMEAAPHNKSPEKKYNGVGGHLFAIAIKLSLVNGFGGHIYFEAKNQDLVDHYSTTFGALHLRTRLHAYRMEIEGDAAQKIIDSYTLEGDLNVR